MAAPTPYRCGACGNRSIQLLGQANGFTVTCGAGHLIVPVPGTEYVIHDGEDIATLRRMIARALGVLERTAERPRAGYVYANNLEVIRRLLTDPAVILPGEYPDDEAGEPARVLVAAAAVNGHHRPAVDETPPDPRGDDGCPAGDPGCDAPDDGEWHCHDACTPPAADVDDVAVVIAAAGLDARFDGTTWTWTAGQHTYTTNSDAELISAWRERLSADELLALAPEPEGLSRHLCAGRTVDDRPCRLAPHHAGEHE